MSSGFKRFVLKLAVTCVLTAALASGQASRANKNRRWPKRFSKMFRC